MKEPFTSTGKNINNFYTVIDLDLEGQVLDNTMMEKFRIGIRGELHSLPPNDIYRPYEVTRKVINKKSVEFFNDKRRHFHLQA